ncbi:tRNA lysidine(34) synthetase TilS [Noviherbaspirillum cavernae]|uniref:tRNA lysidine(34) synthetase TilS n=1 Tax=Noviherbaspirillum cavernae TaxID=2320862 RepID=UPI001F5B6BE2|nr:tRNA lysidine(34) synthetase TilS [Noviherbaspirillum cavernae]
MIDAFECALGEIQTRVCVSGERANVRDVSHSSDEAKIAGVPAIAIAYSGGLDSSVLLALMQRYAARRAIRLFAFHIHHGISPNADLWLAHCQRECERLGIAFEARRIAITGREQSGLEEAARISRYAALGELCRVHNVPLLLTAHHQDDQAETVLLQLLRGSGVAGLAGMEEVNAAPDLLGSADLLMARPLLAASRAELESYAASEGVAYVEDESNADTRYARNALRHRVMPALAEFFPGFPGRIARAAQHAQSAQRLLNELAAQDLDRCVHGECLDIPRLRQLSEDRIDNVLRHWFALRDVRMPATSWLAELRLQLFGARADAQLCVTHMDCHVRRHRDRIFLVPRRDDDARQALPATFRWNGEACIAFAEFHGHLCFEEADEGIDPNWLRQQNLMLRHRSGGERLKPALNRSTRSLKQHYQALDIPSWQREQLPLLTAGGDLLFAAGIGMDCLHFSMAPGPKIRFHWQSDKV